MAERTGLCTDNQIPWRSDQAAHLDILLPLLQNNGQVALPDPGAQIGQHVRRNDIRVPPKVNDHPLQTRQVGVQACLAHDGQAVLRLTVPNCVEDAHKRLDHPTSDEASASLSRVCDQAVDRFTRVVGDPQRQKPGYRVEDETRPGSDPV
jgi:hypothetical protein